MKNVNLQKGELKLIPWDQRNVLYMSSSFWLLVVESRDFSQAEEERTAHKVEQIHNMASILTQNGPKMFF